MLLESTPLARPLGIDLPGPIRQPIEHLRQILDRRAAVPIPRHRSRGSQARSPALRDQVLQGRQRGLARRAVRVLQQILQVSDCSRTNLSH